MFAAYALIISDGSFIFFVFAFDQCNRTLDVGLCEKYQNQFQEQGFVYTYRQRSHFCEAAPNLFVNADFDGVCKRVHTFIITGAVVRKQHIKSLIPPCDQFSPLTDNA